MIQLHNITVAFNDHLVLNNLCASVHQGDFITIIGPNGAGKTTLFDVIAGRIQPHDGTITLDNLVVTTLNEQKRSKQISRLFQNPNTNVVPSLTVAQNLMLAWKKGSPVRLKKVPQQLPQPILERLALCNLDTEKLLKKSMSTLSGGQRQTIALIMATLHIPKILLLDEPTAALDPQAATILIGFAKKLIEQYSITTLMITHNQELAMSLGNKLWVLKEGKIDQKFGLEKRMGMHL